MHAEGELQLFAARRIPVRIKSADKIDRASNGSPGAIIHVGTDISGAAFYFDLVLAQIEAQDPDIAEPRLAHAHQHIECRGFSCAIRSYQRVNRTAWHIQRQVTQ